ncbi:hypothetical protein LCGC14_1496660 [marine sediment metagenome]|uniref:Polymerase/histidinol phosphatase N-terminal domain-containing protein n=1 Tax=marine sediment metagenome TaxID=412755 RepID=A0A0F9J5V2_9ZZZZ
MLRTFLADLHVHTCLSPCGEDEMTPTAIVRQARKMGLDVIAVCDHNSTRNVDPVRRAGRGEGLAVIGGVEVSSEEEVHVLGLFRDDEGLREMQRVIDENLLAENTPSLFGQQWLCDERDTIVGRESRLLIGATGLTIEEVVERIHRLGGLAVPSHVDRERFSILSQLGFVPEGLPVDALEVSPLRSLAEATRAFDSIRGFPLIRSSDAHRLAEIGTVSTVFTAAEPSVEELAKALLGEDGRELMN